MPKLLKCVDIHVCSSECFALQVTKTYTEKHLELWAQVGCFEIFISIKNDEGPFLRSAKS